jgi:hypothetical protein
MPNVPGYENRQVDILVLQVNAATLGKTAQRVPMSFGQSPKITAGIQKALQSFLSLLFTKKGGAWNQNLGCGFLGALEQGLVRTPVDARNYFAKDVPSLVAQVNTGVTKPDEILVSAVLEDVVVERQRVSLRIRLWTAAGTSLTFLAPV